MKINSKFFLGVFFALCWIAGVISQLGYDNLATAVGITAAVALFASLLGYLNG